MAKPKHNYDSEEFYQEIYGYAFQGAKDAEIADFLDLEPETFNRMKHGIFEFWTDEQNKKRSERICQVLYRARNKVNFVVRGRYLKAALGGIKIKNKTTTRRKLRINGSYTDDEDVMTVEHEAETAPNMSALATWLYHHDKEWRNIQKGLEPEDESNAEGGIDISKWIQKEMSND